MTDKTYRHGDSMTDQAQRAESAKIVLNVHKHRKLLSFFQFVSSLKCLALVAFNIFCGNTITN